MILTTVCLGLSYKLCLYKFLDLFFTKISQSSIPNTLYYYNIDGNNNEETRY